MEKCCGTCVHEHRQYIPTHITDDDVELSVTCDVHSHNILDYVTCDSVNDKTCSDWTPKE